MLSHLVDKEIFIEKLADTVKLKNPTGSALASKYSNDFRDEYSLSYTIEAERQLTLVEILKERRSLSISTIPKPIEMSMNQ